MSQKLRILLVDDEVAILQCITTLLERQGYYVETAQDGEEALALIDKFHFHIVVTDLNMSHLNGIELLSNIKEKYPHLVVIFLTGYSSVELAVKAIKLGAYDFIEKPFQPRELIALIEKAAEEKQLLSSEQKTIYKKRNTHRFENIIGSTIEMHNIFEEIKSVADTSISVLIVGENGTGKELIANAIHSRSSRREKPLVKVNCGALAESVVESELFGHEKGAFTGALRLRKGLFEMADNGTLFLDEIGELSTFTQVKLLRVLENWTFQRVGGEESLKSDFRFICATNKDLSLAVTNKEFREDLYYRINTAIIYLPPLRERRADIPLLNNYFLKKYSKQMKKNINSISCEANSFLVKHDWPGNVRELAHAIERSVAYCKGSELLAENLPYEIRNIPDQSEIQYPSESVSLTDVESAHIYTVLVANNWNMKKAANVLNISRSTLYKKLEKYDLRKPACNFQ